MVGGNKNLVQTESTGDNFSRWGGEWASFWATHLPSSRENPEHKVLYHQQNFIHPIAKIE